MKQEGPTLETPKWDTVFLVCKHCGKRSSGPKGLKSKTVARTVRQVGAERRPRPRVVMTACLGLCPKGAIAVAVAGTPVDTRIVSIRNEDQIEGAVASLLARGVVPD